MTAATKHLTVEISAHNMGALQAAIVSLAGGMDAESIAAVRIDDRACCAELDIVRASDRRN